MVTIAIRENGSEIAELLQNMLAYKGFSLGTEKSPAESDYVLLSDTSKSCDILLLHDPKDAGTRADYITIINADRSWEHINPGKCLLISYGLSPLATLTASSFRAEPENNRFFCCIQRSIVTLRGKIIEPQEFPVLLPKTISDISAGMAYVCLALLLSVPPEDFGHFVPSPENDRKKL